MYKFKLLIICFFITIFQCSANDKPFIKVNLSGQMGNNLFQLATGYALAWDNNAEVFCPDLLTRKFSESNDNFTHVFSRCNAKTPRSKPNFTWKEPLSKMYTLIPFKPKMAIKGYFQLEKYFKHHRKKILDLFAPIKEDYQYIQKKFGHILNNPALTTVGVQFRWYWDDTDTNYFIQYGSDYLKKTTDLFPDALFIVSTNRIQFAQEHMPKNVNVIYLTDEPQYIDFYILTLCQHNIITNSSFGWWTAWLNDNPNKIVVAPNQWFNPNSNKINKIVPDQWIKIDAKWGNAKIPSTVY